VDILRRKKGRLKERKGSMIYRIGFKWIALPSLTRELVFFRFTL